MQEPARTSKTSGGSYRKVVEMHFRFFFSSFLFSVFLFACTPTVTPTPSFNILNIYNTAATQPWLGEVYDCVPSGAIIRIVDDPRAADISIQLGDPDFAPAFVYQIDTEDILVVTHRQSPVQNMTVEDVRELFAGQSNLPVVIWVYSSGDDTQKAFEREVIQGRIVTSQARMAVSPQHMSDILNNEQNTVGILPRHWKVGDSRFVFTIPDVPVLAVMREEPQGMFQELVACLQK